jgi:predicted RNase H-like nuclease (RuvC/YqgF family)
MDRIRFRPLSAKPRYIIVGIDPGTTTATAALDLDGNLLHLQSSRQMSLSDVTESLYKVGKPLIIASDVHEMPFSVEKIRRAFKAVSYTPRQDVSVETKLELTSPFTYGNDHERDALSAALDAFRSYKNKFQSILKRVPPGYDLDEVRAGIVRGQSLEQVIGEMKGKAPPEKEETPEKEPERKEDERVRVLEGTVKRLRILVQELSEDIRKKDHDLTRLQSRLKKIRSNQDLLLRKDTEIVKRDVIIQNLKKKLRKEERATRNLRKRVARMKEFDELVLSADHIPLKILPSFTREGVKNLDEEFGIREGDLLYVDRIDGWGRNVVKDLSETGIMGIIVGNPDRVPDDPNFREAFLESGLPLLLLPKEDVIVKGKQGLAQRESVHIAITDWEESEKEYDRGKKASMIEDIYREYRTERGKEMKKVG